MPTKRPGSVIGRKNRSASGARHRGAAACQPVGGHRPDHERQQRRPRRRRSPSSRARRVKISEPNVSRYQRSEKPVNGNDSAAGRVEREEHDHRRAGRRGRRAPRSSRRRSRGCAASVLMPTNRIRSSLSDAQHEQGRARSRATKRAEHQERERRAERPVPGPGQRRLDPDAEHRAVGAAEELRRDVVGGREHEDEHERRRGRSGDEREDRRGASGWARSRRGPARPRRAQARPAGSRRRARAPRTAGRCGRAPP